MPITGSTTPEDKDGITYELDVDVGGVSERVGQETSGITVECVVEYEAAEKWKQEMVGYSSGTTGTKIHRVLPEKCGWDDNLYCMQLDRTQSIRGASLSETLGESDWPTFETLRYNATFAAPMYEVLEDDQITDERERFCIWERRLTAENEKIPGGGFKFPSDNKIVEQVAIKVARVIELRCTWVDTPVAPYSTIKACANRINAAAITLNGIEYDTETVLFKGMDEKRRRNPFAQFTYDLVYTLLIRADGRTWNELWRVDAAGDVVYEAPEDAAGNKIYRTADLTALWRV